MIFPVLSRKPIFARRSRVRHDRDRRAVRHGVGTPPMYVTGAVMLPFFAFMTMLIAVPTGVKIYNWIGTL